MFKLVVLCVFATAVAEPEPQLLYGSGLTYASYPAVVPAATITNAGVIAQAAPVVYSHFIKKRSADPEPEPEAKPEASPEAKADPQLLTYGSSLLYPNTYASTAFNPFISYSGYPYGAYPLATHLIKKRSAQFLTPNTYVPSTYSVPTYNAWPTTYLGNNIYPSAVDVVLNQHLIKKRSAEPQLPLVSPWAGAYSAIPSLYNSYIPSVPNTYLGDYPGVVGLHAIKKRSAQLLAASAYSATTPILSSTYTASSPYISGLPYVASPYSTFIKK